MNTTTLDANAILDAIARWQHRHAAPADFFGLCNDLGTDPPTLRRHLETLTDDGSIRRVRRGALGGEPDVALV